MLILRETLALDGAAMKLLAIFTGLIAAALLQALIDRPLERWRRKMLAKAEARNAAPNVQMASCRYVEKMKRFQGYSLVHGIRVNYGVQIMLVST